MWANAKTVVLNALENRGQTDDSMVLMCLRWAEECVKRLGIVPEYYQKADRLAIRGNSIHKPKGLISVRNLWVCSADGIPTPTYYGGKNSRKVFDPDGCCDFYRFSYQSGILLMEDDTCFFSATVPLSNYDHALIEYNGLIYDDEGHIRVPEVAVPAVEQYIEYRLTKREMKMDRSKVQRVEVAQEYEEWLRDMGVAYGRLKMPSVASLMERAERKFGINMPTPNRRLR